MAHTLMQMDSIINGYLSQVADDDDALEDYVALLENTLCMAREMQLLEVGSRDQDAEVGTRSVDE